MLLTAVVLLAGLLSGCSRAPAPEPPVAYFQGAMKKAPQYFSQAKPTLVQAPPGEIPQDTPNQTGGPIPAAPESVGDAPGEADGTAGTEVRALPAAAVPLAPTYQVIAERFNDRPDDMSHFYVVIDRVDPNADAFKQVVKQVLVALAAANSGPVFSASIWDHLSAAQTEVSYRSNPEQFSDELISAKESFNDQHLIANYVGGLSSVNEPPSYLLFWFPHAGATSPNVGQWVSAEIWKP